MVDSGYMEAGGEGCGQPAEDGDLSRGPHGAAYHVQASGRRTNVTLMSAHLPEVYLSQTLLFSVLFM